MIHHNQTINAIVSLHGFIEISRFSTTYWKYRVPRDKCIRSKMCCHAKNRFWSAEKTESQSSKNVFKKKKKNWHIEAGRCLKFQGMPSLFIFWITFDFFFLLKVFKRKTQYFAKDVVRKRREMNCERPAGLFSIKTAWAFIPPGCAPAHLAGLPEQVSNLGRQFPRRRHQ